MVKNNIGSKNKFKSILNGIFGKTKEDRVFHSLNYIFFLIFGLIMLYPFMYVLKVSFENIKLIEGVPTTVYNFTAYKAVLENESIIRAFFLSVYVVVLHVVTHIFFSLLSAYPLSKKHLQGRVKIIFFVVFTMMFSGGMVPSYILIMNVLNWQNNLLVYIVPGIITGFNIIIVKNFFSGIPESLEESAKLDGANDLTILMSIYMPLSMPIIATIALWSGVGKWNNWMTGLLYITDNDKLLIQNILQSILTSATSTDPSAQNPDLIAMADNVKMATIVVGTLPIIAIYPFVQKYFVKGMIVGSVKG